MKTPNVLIIADYKDAKDLDTESKSQHWNIWWDINDYSRLLRRTREIQVALRMCNADFVLYSRNDQVWNRVSIGPLTRSLRTGYSSFSGIDQSKASAQMKSCFEDFINCTRTVDFSIDEDTRTERQGRGTFSLVFDTEQMGCVRYGLPRILRLMNRYGARGIFFLTNIMTNVYRNVVDEIRRRGHEVGIHGMWHEYLSGLREEEQTRAIGRMISGLGGEVSGANFIYRMDECTAQAMAKNRLRYFVYPLMNNYLYTSYPKVSTRPRLMRMSSGKIWGVPICVETYGRPWLSVKWMLDSALAQAKKCGFLHLTILCHPFRDGNICHIQTTNRLLSYLTEKGMRGVTLDEMVRSQPEDVTPASSVREVLFGGKSGALNATRTRHDIIALMPENLIKSYAYTRRGHGIF